MAQSDFYGLVQDLVAAHEHDQSLLQALVEENQILRERLGISLSGDAGLEEGVQASATPLRETGRGVLPTPYPSRPRVGANERAAAAEWQPLPRAAGGGLCRGALASLLCPRFPLAPRPGSRSRYVDPGESKGRRQPPAPAPRLSSASPPPSEPTSRNGTMRRGPSRGMLDFDSPEKEEFQIPVQLAVGDALNSLDSTVSHGDKQAAEAQAAGCMGRGSEISGATQDTPRFNRRPSYRRGPSAPTTPAAGTLQRSNTSIFFADVQKEVPDLREEFQAEQPSVCGPDGNQPYHIRISHATGEEYLLEDSCIARLVVKPSSPQRLFWDALSSVMVCYDIVTIPLMAFNIDSNEFIKIMDWTTAIFWTVDFPCSLITGFHREGLVETRPGAIIKNYAQTWMTFDICLIAVDWIFLASAAQENNAVGFFRIGKTTRIARILRVVRILRFLRLQRVVAEVIEMVNSDYVRAIFSVTASVVLILFLNHYLACGWYWLGTEGMHRKEANWLAENDMEDSPGFYRYATALHWSLTQFTPASMEIHPHNLQERIYNIFAVFFALVTFSSFLGTITAAMTQLRKYKSETLKQQYTLRRYFVKNKVSADLSQCVWTFLKENHFSRKTRAHKQDVEILQQLPSYLSKRLHQELYGPYLAWCPFFNRYMDLCPEAFVEVCSKAVKEKSLMRREELFHTGDLAEQVHFVISGDLYYPHRVRELARNVGQGAWFCEPALWVVWYCCSRPFAETFCELLCCDVKLFSQNVCRFEQAMPYVRQYALHFVEYMRSMEDDLWRTDVHTNRVKQGELAAIAWRETVPFEDNGEVLVEKASSSLSKNVGRLRRGFVRPWRVLRFGRASS